MVAAFQRAFFNFKCFHEFVAIENLVKMKQETMAVVCYQRTE